MSIPKVCPPTRASPESLSRMRLNTGEAIVPSPKSQVPCPRRPKSSVPAWDSGTWALGLLSDHRGNFRSKVVGFFLDTLAHLVAGKTADRYVLFDRADLFRNE